MCLNGDVLGSPHDSEIIKASVNSIVPSYLKGYEALYAQNPRAAALSWFKDAKFGLFMHYGIYSLLGRHEWVMYRENIPLAEYEQLKNKFKAEEFDADFITDLALKSEMKYINITSRHHDSFCLFESKVSDYNSMQSPARRDLVGELSDQCQKKGLGLFLYYSYALDWRHPYFYPRSIYRIARPDYSEKEPRYKWQRDEDFEYYIEFVHAQIKELMSNYGPIAGIWFDPIMGYYARPDLFPIEQTYAMVRNMQPQTLISFKQGANGTEDFAAPERAGQSLAERVRQQVGPEQAVIAQEAWQKNKAKHNEICDTLQPQGWGYIKADDGKHRGVVDVMQMLTNASQQKCNLLLNTGPLPDGFIHTDDVKTLLEVGRKVRKDGWPS
ncbi:alpha-L-fucosidase [Planctomycetota bacterium]